MENGITRRGFLKISALGGASLIAGGCNRDSIEKLVPLMSPPYDYLPGVSIFFATTCQECSAACGMMVNTREGRAIKVEGNPWHPINEGRLCLQGQSTVQGLYSPARAKGPMGAIYREKHPVSWDEAIGRLVAKLRVCKEKGRGILYIGPPRSGTFPTMIRQWIEAMGGGTYLQFDLTPVHSLVTANEMVFGRKEIPHFALDKAEVLINFGADFLETWLNPIQMARSYTKMHSVQEGPKSKKGKYIHIAPHMGMTGTNADMWVPCPVGKEAWVALGMSRMILDRASHLSEEEKEGLGHLLSPFTEKKVAENTGLEPALIKKLAQEFVRNGRSLAIAGGNCSASKEATLLQVAVNILNYVAGNLGKTVIFGADYQIGGSSMEEVEAAVRGLRDGSYALAIIENVNPIFTLPAELGLKEALATIPLVVSLSTGIDETSQIADLHLPTSHFLESWGDANPRKGIHSIQQPAMAAVPGLDTREAGDLLLQVATKVGVKDLGFQRYRDYVKSSWKALHQQLGTSLSFEQFWKLSLQRGGHFQDFNPIPVSLNAQVFDTDFSPLYNGRDGGIRLMAFNSTLHNANAKGANRPWLHEIPHPVTQVVWDSWVEINPETAEKLGIRHGDLVEISTSKGRVKVAAYLFYGIHKEVVAMPAGMGREVLVPTYASSRGKNRMMPILEGEIRFRYEKVGVNAMDLLPFRKDRLSGDFVFAGEEVHIRPTGKKADLVTMDGQYRKDIWSRGVKDTDGFGDRSQKGRGFVQVLALSDGTLHELSGSETPQRKHFYTLKRKDRQSFYDPLPENVKKAAAKSDKPTPEYYRPYKWGMIIDLDKCTGCSACVAACYAENNIPVVGKDRCALGREMSWIRIERYFEPNKRTGRLETYYTPQMCQQCGNAGCETVCPVFATYHTPDGLNAMIYNRCVGTRFCANNCPYAVRRFNWRSYKFPAPLNLQLNPAVSVRSKGVMEKCTFCQHRIREAKDLAKDQGRKVKDGEVLTACQQACPTDAIVFGNVRDKKSKVSRMIEGSHRGYTQLPELNYHPSITYLKKVNHKGQKA